MKPMSAGDYRANAEKVRSQRPTEIVKLTSGSVFELRRPDLGAYMVTGRLPQSLVKEGLKAWKTKATADKIVSDLNDEEVVDSLVFMREIVHDCTVRPRFVEFATNEDEIGAADMLVEDFNEIFAWAMNYEGVAGVAGLRGFRAGSERGTAGDRAYGKKQRRKAKPPLETVKALQ